MRRTLLLTASVVLIAREAGASGYHIDEQEPRATGRAGAVTANPSNGSAMHYNPGGVGTLNGLGIEVGASLLVTNADFKSAVTGAVTDAETKVSALPQAYVTYRLSDLLAFGIGFNAPFGLRLTWPETSPGRTNVRD